MTPVSNNLCTRQYASAGGIVIRDGDVLLLHRTNPVETRLPKGHIDPGESRKTSALREVREETGYANPQVLHDLGHQDVRFVSDGTAIERDESYFLMTLADNERTPMPPEDAEQFRSAWTPLEEAEQQLTFEAEREWLRRARAWHETLMDKAA